MNASKYEEKFKVLFLKKLFCKVDKTFAQCYVQSVSFATISLLIKVYLLKNFAETLYSMSLLIGSLVRSRPAVVRLSMVEVTCVRHVGQHKDNK